MKKSKALLLALCAAALSVGVTFGTLAYLTDTEAVTNTFTVGQVHISLDEAKVNEKGQPLKGETVVKEVKDADRVTENKYRLIPGQTYTKDPTIYVSNDSEECYLFVKVENGIAAIEDETKSVANQMESKGWVKIDGNGDGKVTDADNVYALAKGKDAPDFTYTVFGGAEVVVFDEFTIDGEKTVNVEEGKTAPADKFDIAEYKNAKIIVTAYAIQAAGFDNANLAWEAYAAQHPNP